MKPFSIFSKRQLNSKVSALEERSTVCHFVMRYTHFITILMVRNIYDVIVILVRTRISTLYYYILAGLPDSLL